MRKCQVEDVLLSRSLQRLLLLCQRLLMQPIRLLLRSDFLNRCSALRLLGLSVNDLRAREGAQLRPARKRAGCLLAPLNQES